MPVEIGSANRKNRVNRYICAPTKGPGLWVRPRSFIRGAHFLEALRIQFVTPLQSGRSTPNECEDD